MYNEGVKSGKGILAVTIRKTQNVSSEVDLPTERISTTTSAVNFAAPPLPPPLSSSLHQPPTLSHSSLSLFFQLPAQLAPSKYRKLSSFSTVQTVVLFAESSTFKLFLEVELLTLLFFSISIPTNVQLIFEREKKNYPAG
ncbi:hypothetical protein H5410_018185 [Solanum commersonii]|uniref:Uncharacterized protein n=1 Tax=Solanum commersonii TaxID=4109 RepID=A0A9J6A1E1_SOLCO|nr:hypothetical protein H5410_018185 [Solanum commersonii]